MLNDIFMEFKISIPNCEANFKTSMLDIKRTISNQFFLN